MPFRKGHPPPPNAGRKVGVPNKFTRNAREAFQLAFEGMGGYAALEKWGKANRTEFFKLYARLIPVEHVGEGGEGPIKTIVKHVYETVNSQKP